MFVGFPCSRVGVPAQDEGLLAPVVVPRAILGAAKHRRGFGKAIDVASAINKAKEDAKKNIFKAPIINSTIPHELRIKYGSVRLLLKPASPGTGIIAGGAVRAVLELAGVTNILSKITGSSNPVNVVKAVQKGLMELRDPLMVARDRGVNLKQLFS